MPKPISCLLNIAPRGMSFYGQELRHDEGGSVTRPPVCPPVDVNEVPQVVTTPGASGPRAGILYSSLIGTKTHVKPSGAFIGVFAAFLQSDAVASLRLRSRIVVSAACPSPITASANRPQKMRVGVHVMPSFSQVPITADASNFIVIVGSSR